MLEKLIKERVESLLPQIENTIYEHCLSDEDKFDLIKELINKIILGKN
jgi:hypothetical protein